MYIDEFVSDGSTRYRGESAFFSAMEAPGAAGISAMTDRYAKLSSIFTLRGNQNAKKYQIVRNLSFHALRTSGNGEEGNRILGNSDLGGSAVGVQSAARACCPLEPISRLSPQKLPERFATVPRLAICP
jgi:hypothetical protein